MLELIIVGGGIAGGACALRAAQYHLPSAWVLGDRKTAKQSRSKWVLNIDNMIGISPGIVLEKLADRLGDDVPHLDIGTQDIIDDVHRRIAPYADVLEVVEGAAVGAREVEGGFEVSVDGREPLVARNLVIATGVMDRQPAVAREYKGKLRDLTNWVYPFANRESLLYCIRCEGHLTRGQRAAVIGGSETAAQVALMLAERYGSVVAILANGEPVEVEPRTQRLLDHFGIVTHPQRIIDIQEPEGAERGVLGALVLDGGERIEVSFAMVSLGLYRVYNDLARQLDVELTDPDEPAELRHVRIDSRGETSVRGVFAVGDLARRDDEPVMKQIYTCQEYAVRAVDTVDRRRRSRRRKEILGE